MAAAYQTDLDDLGTDLQIPDADTPLGEALRWWADRVRRRDYVGLREGLPSAQAVAVLRDRELLAETVGGWGFAIRTPNIPAEAALRRNGWGLVAAALSRYEPAAIDRISAVRLFIGEENLPGRIRVRHAANSSKWTLGLTDDVSIILQPDDTMPAELTDVTLGASPAVTLRTINPADVLCSIPLADLRENMDAVAAWLRTLVVGQPSLERAFARSPRPVVLKRMAHIAREVENRRLADLIDSVLVAQTTVKVSRAQTGVGSNLIIPRYVSAAAPAASPWLERYRIRVARALDVVANLAGEFEAHLSALDANTIMSIAKAAKADDAYHSTTIEGYRITRDEVQAVLAGNALHGRPAAEMERLMALEGYAQAFDWTLARIRDASTPIAAPRITESFFLDLYIELWSASIDAGVTDAPALRAWRNQAVLINGSDHVPPGPEKLSALMSQFAAQLNAASVGPITRAIVGHWGFVHLHPFRDGNGRVARFAMNYLLGAAGIPWTTIRVEERSEYFDALERAHAREDFKPFATFIVKAVERSYAERAS